MPGRVRRVRDAVAVVDAARAGAARRGPRRRRGGWGDGSDTLCGRADGAVPGHPLDRSVIGYCDHCDLFRAPQRAARCTPRGREREYQPTEKKIKLRANGPAVYFF